MPEIGRTVSHYRIIEKLGQGGMGEVFLAQDVSLDRKVALKFLPDIFAGDPERLARFEREAKLLASLNHPNIAAIHGLEEAEGKRFLVMELAEGETLAQRIAKGPIPVDETLEVCRQIAEGLEAAHEKGILHRDLKPANVKVTAEGKVKILDFGLAKAFQGEAAPADASKSPTLTDQMTRPGVILGTAAYMSPEQAKGRSVDKRADIWAFGCILYECLTGKRAFEGESVTETMAAILRGDPDYGLLPAEHRAPVSLVLRQCLQKDPRLRFRDITDVWHELQDLMAAVPLESLSAASGREKARRRFLTWGLATLATAASAIATWMALHPSPAQPNLHLSLEANITDAFSVSPPFAISPDGSRMVYVSEFQNEQMLFQRRLDQFQAVPIPGTEDARDPFFSHDGQAVGFFSRGRLRKVSLSGGTPDVVCEVPTGNGWGTWGPDDTIVFATWALNTGLYSVPANGPKAEILTNPRIDQGELEHRQPCFLPNSRKVLFVVATAGRNRLAMIDLESQELKSVDMPGSAKDAHYVASGHLIYYDSGKLLAQRFDSARMNLSGTTEVVIDGVFRSYQPGTSPYVDVSDMGCLLYLPAETSRYQLELVWMNRMGQATPIAIEGEMLSRPRLSPNGREVAVCQRTDTGSAIFLYNLDRGGRRKLASAPGAFGPVWSPGSKHVAYCRADSSGRSLYRIAVEAAGGEELLLASQYPKWATDMSPDGRHLAYYEVHPKTGRDIWILPLQGEGKPECFLATPASEHSAVFSPNGKWIAYASDESGRDEIYVLSFPKSEKGPQQVSIHGGREPVWFPDGKGLYYRRRNQLVEVPIKMEPTFAPGQEQLVFEGIFAEEVAGHNQNYWVSPDNQRFLMLRLGDGTALQNLRIVSNWFEELKRLVPTGKM